MPERSFFATRGAMGALGLLATLAACGEDARSPTAPESAAPAPSALAEAKAPLAFRQVSEGAFFTCGVTVDDRAWCWGYNVAGQLGNGTNKGPESCGSGIPCSTRPVAVLGGLEFREVSAGHSYACGVTTDDRAYCWGDNLFGELGDGTTTERHVPVAVRGGLRFSQVSAGASHTCGTTTDGRPYCWGDNFHAQLGDGSITEQLRPVAVVGGHEFRQVSAGGFHTCGVTTDDRVYCWGRNDDGQVGDSTNHRRRFRPVPVAGGHAFIQVSAGFDYTCAVTPHARAFCWGSAQFGQLGNGHTFPFESFWPRPVAGGLGFERVTAGLSHTCGETTQNRTYCWGDNASGELGDGTTIQRTRPVAVAGGRVFAQANAGGFHTCSVTPAAVAFCWGNNDEGQLGDGTITERRRPTRVVGPS